MHLFSGEAPPEATTSRWAEVIPEAMSTDSQRLERLQGAVRELRREIEDFKRQFAQRGASTPSGES